MAFRLQSSRRLHKEHQATLVLLRRFEHALSGHARTFPPAAADTEWETLVRTLAGALHHEIANHLQFEDEKLFPPLRAAGAAELVELLSEEHGEIRDVVSALMPLLHASLVAESNHRGWEPLKMLGLELCERLKNHIDREEGALLPALDATLDQAIDAMLIADYEET